MLQQKRFLLFDLFHTLTSIETAMQQIPPESWRIMGLDRDTWKREWIALAPARTRGEVADVAALMAAVAKRIDPSTDGRLIERAVESRAGKFAVALRGVDRKVVHSLRELHRRGKRIALVSNADKMEIAAWPGSPLHDAFDATVFSCDVGCAKPEPEIYLIACRRLKADPVDCVFIGDGNGGELSGAKALGMTAVQMTGIVSRFWPELVEERGRDADFRIDSIASLCDA